MHERRRIGHGAVAVQAPHVPRIARDRLEHGRATLLDPHRTHDLLGRDEVRARRARLVQRILAAVAEQGHEPRSPGVVGVLQQAANRVARPATPVEFVVHRLERAHEHAQSLGLPVRRQAVGRGQQCLGRDDQIVRDAFARQPAPRHGREFRGRQERRNVEHDVVPQRAAGARVLEAHGIRRAAARDHGVG